MPSLQDEINDLTARAEGLVRECRSRRSHGKSMSRRFYLACEACEITLDGHSDGQVLKNTLQRWVLQGEQELAQEGLS